MSTKTGENVPIAKNVEEKKQDGGEDEVIFVEQRQVPVSLPSNLASREEASEGAKDTEMLEEKENAKKDDASTSASGNAKKDGEKSEENGAEGGSGNEEGNEEEDYERAKLMIYNPKRYIVKTKEHGLVEIEEILACPGCGIWFDIKSDTPFLPRSIFCCSRYIKEAVVQKICRRLNYVPPKKPHDPYWQPNFDFV